MPIPSINNTDFDGNDPMTFQFLPIQNMVNFGVNWNPKLKSIQKISKCAAQNEVNILGTGPDLGTNPNSTAQNIWYQP